jgi:hypothetical protein
MTAPMTFFAGLPVRFNQPAQRSHEAPDDHRDTNWLVRGKVNRSYVNRQSPHPLSAWFLKSHLAALA